MLRRDFILGILAGLLVGIGGCVNLSCENKYAGAFLFSVALLVICLQGYALFTGKVGFLVISHKKADILSLLAALFGNWVGTLAAGLPARVMLSAVATEKAAAVCNAKLLQTIPEAFLRAIFCGILMYLAVVIWRENRSVLGVFLCVPVFILCGFEHSIANMFYFSAAGIHGFGVCLYILNIVFGNSVGGMLIPLMLRLGGRTTEPANKKGSTSESVDPMQGGLLK